mmetsp:Transcript_24203/g.31416  ORF Transcript_24203/g.31416 Transcript_24203/m.31416 type:complete len:89 (-) Transcript_24203:446-712(-)
MGSSSAAEVQVKGVGAATDPVETDGTAEADVTAKATETGVIETGRGEIEMPGHSILDTIQCHISHKNILIWLKAWKELLHFLIGGIAL